jgi:WD40 repeat protein
MYRDRYNFEYLNTFKGRQGKITFVAFCTGGQTLISGSWTKIKIWNLQTRREIRTLINSSKALSISSICLSHDEHTLACQNGRGIIKVWNLKTGQQTHTFRAHASSISALAISSNGQTLASSSYDGTVKIWDLKKRREREIMLFVASPSDDSLVFSQDKQTLAYISSGFIKVVHWQTNEEIYSLDDEHFDPVCLAISADGQILVSGGWYDAVVWNLLTGEIIHTLEGHLDCVSSIVISPDSQILASGSYDKTIKIWDLVKGQEICNFTGHTDRVTSIAISATGQKIASGSLDGTIKVWKVK